MNQNKESAGFIFKIAIILSAVCATLVSISAVTLKPIQDRNVALEKKRNILVAAGVYKKGEDIEVLFKDKIEAKMIELSSGDFITDADTDSFDMIASSKNPETGKELTSEEDIASIKRISKNMVVYLQKGDSGNIESLILPIYGYGLWGTMYGFLATDHSGNKIKGITFYDHKETPGLGGEIANPKWQETWVGKTAYRDNEPGIRLVKTKSTKESEKAYEIDSLAGATLTSVGVENTIKFWLGDNGYKFFLEKQKGHE